MVSAGAVRTAPQSLLRPRRARARFHAEDLGGVSPCPLHRSPCRTGRPPRSECGKGSAGLLRLCHAVLLSTTHRGARGSQRSNRKSQRTNGGEAVTTPPPRGAPSKPNRCLLLWDARHGLLRARVQDDTGTPSATDKGAADLGLRPPPARPSVPTGALGACHVTVGPTASRPGRWRAAW